MKDTSNAYDDSIQDHRWRSVSVSPGTLLTADFQSTGASRRCRSRVGYDTYDGGWD